ncbi:hypothetical protein C8R45DRAFT_944741 [Mycena sanguinolenta]|nr:hypothetical protein C8R45DRAFT_944741 [Mycena sanguinolenta]
MPGLGLGLGGLGLHIPQARARALGAGPEALSPGQSPGFFRAKKKKSMYAMIAIVLVPRGESQSRVAIIVESMLVNQPEEKFTPKDACEFVREVFMIFFFCKLAKRIVNPLDRIGLQRHVRHDATRKKTEWDGRSQQPVYERRIQQALQQRESLETR